MGSEKQEEDDKGSASGGQSPAETHRRSGAPTDEAHREAGDGALTGSIPAGLTADELRKLAEEDRNVEPGTG